MINIVFTRPFFKPKIGGVEIYTRLLVQYLDKDKFNVYNIESAFKDSKKRSKAESFLIKLYLLFYLLKFPLILKQNEIDVVHSNPSMQFIPIFREGFFIIISVLFKKKIFVFFHGWNEKHANILKRKVLLRFIFSKVYGKADIIAVLANEFKKYLVEIGIKNKIIVEKTMIDDNLLKGYAIKPKKKCHFQDEKFSILFLSRIEKAKGIFEAIKAFQILIDKGYDLILNIAGEGSSLLDAKQYVDKNRLLNVKFLGYVEGNQKRDVFGCSDLFFFPTYYGEGCPIAILEAICFGLPVITRPVGGIKDFFIDQINGFVTESKLPYTYSLMIEKLILDNKLRNKISNYNYKFGRNNYLASASVKRIEKIYTDLSKK